MSVTYFIVFEHCLFYNSRSIMPVKLLLILHSWFITPSYEYVLVSSLLRHFLLIAHPPLHQEVLSYRTLVIKLFLLQDSLLCQAGSSARRLSGTGPPSAWSPRHPTSPFWFKGSAPPATPYSGGSGCVIFCPFCSSMFFIDRDSFFLLSSL